MELLLGELVAIGALLLGHVGIVVYNRFVAVPVGR
jgi:hypothetical protein